MLWAHVEHRGPIYRASSGLRGHSGLAQVAEQIRAAQQKAALGGQAPAAWAIGARCQAVWSGDGGWYGGAVTGVSAGGNFIVSFDEDGGVEEVQ